ncbi:hypothetical protein MT418_007520 [Batrachochytrium dendrobatidis]
MSDLVDNDKLDSYAAYVDKHGLFDLFHNIITKITIEKPVEPFQFIIDRLQKPFPTSILVIGPPSCGQKTIIESLVRTYDAVHVHAGSLIRNAIEKKTTIGIQAQAYLDRGHLVPDDIIISLVLSRLQNESDVIERGYVLEGYPRTREQAVAMLRKGLIPDHTIVFDIPDEMVINRVTGLRHDPITGKTYHIKYDPPPKNALIEDRLTRRQSDTETATQARLNLYRQHIHGVLAYFKTNARVFRYPEGISTKENEVLQDIYEFLGTQHISQAPSCHKIIIAGLPGSGKSLVSEAISKKYGYIHVSPKKVILEEIASGSHWGNTLKPFISTPEKAPQGYLVELIVERLKRKDCLNHGWILDGFPLTKFDAEALRSKGMVPNRLVWLDTDAETCTNRLVHRRYDPITGCAVNIQAIPEHLQSTHTAEWIHFPEDMPESVSARIKSHLGVKNELKKVFGSRDSLVSTGIMYTVRADGLGERDHLNNHPTFDRVFELVESSLLRPILIEQRAEY